MGGAVRENKGQPPSGRVTAVHHKFPCLIARQTSWGDPPRWLLWFTGITAHTELCTSKASTGINTIGGGSLFHKHPQAGEDTPGSGVYAKRDREQWVQEVHRYVPD